MENSSLSSLKQTYEELENKINIREKAFQEDIKGLEEDYKSSIEILNKEKELIGNIIKQLETLTLGKKNIAVFIDSDNVSVIYIRKIMKDIYKKGNAVIKRAYGNWKDNLLSQWDQPIEDLGIEKVYQEQLTLEKNATDMRLSTEIIDVYHQKRDIDTFVILSSDSDYTPVVKNIKEKGKEVIVYGKDDASKMLKKEASEFINYEDFKETILQKVDMLKEEIKVMKTEVKKEGKITNNKKNLLKEINKIFKEKSKNGRLEFGILGQEIIPKNYGFSLLTQLAETIPGYYVESNKTTGKSIIKDTRNYKEILSEIFKNSKKLIQGLDSEAVEFGVIGKSMNLKDFGFKNVTEMINKSEIFEVYQKHPGANYMIKKRNKPKTTDTGKDSNPKPVEKDTDTPKMINSGFQMISD